MADLLELAKRVEDGDVSADLALIDEIANALGVCGEGFVSDALEWQKIDGAKALHDAVLPGWEWAITTTYMSNYHVVAVGDGSNEGFEATAITPAAAWVAAILRAKAGMKE